MPQFRIRYTVGNQRTPMTTVVSGETQGEAVAIFGRHNPRSKVSGVDKIDDTAARPTRVCKPAAPVVTLSAEDRPITDADRAAIREQAARLREELRRLPVRVAHQGHQPG